GQRTVSTDREALETLMNVYIRVRPLLKLILEIRDLESMLRVVQSPIGADGRMRFSFNVAGTETGRWSSSGHWRNVLTGTAKGSQFQNITKELRAMFIPDPGYVFVYPDLEQAESRGVAYLSGDENYIDRAIFKSEFPKQVRAPFRITPPFIKQPRIEGLRSMLAQYTNDRFKPTKDLEKDLFEDDGKVAAVHWLKDKLEIQINYMICNPELDYSIGMRKFILVNNCDFPPYIPLEIRENPHIAYVPGTLMVKSEVFEITGYFNAKYIYASDSDWFLKAKDAGLKIGYIKKLFLISRIHDKNL
ncbi:hypothetical protein IID20_02550, partial [Patescibacteria group bacterium]|nr:hypothetical protein [Patescibacteria group bacterium]